MSKIFRNQRPRSAFTLIEMSLVLLIIAMLLIVMLPNLNQQKESAESSVNKAFAKNMETQVMLYESETGNRPTWEELVTKGYITKEQADKAKALELPNPK